MVNGQLTHFGDSRLARHIGKAVLREDAPGCPAGQGTHGLTRRIDAAVAAVMAHDGAGTVRDSIYYLRRYDPGAPVPRGRSRTGPGAQSGPVSETDGRPTRVH